MNFFLSPSQALVKDAQNRFDFATESGRALYDRSTRSLYPKGEYYDSDPDQMFTLLHLLGHRAAEVWTGTTPSMDPAFCGFPTTRQT
jgi:hypothetical protein